MVVVVVVTTVVWVAGAKVNCPNISSVDPSCIVDKVAPTSAERSFPGTTEGGTGPFEVEGRRRTFSTRKEVSGELPEARVEGFIIDTR